MKCNVSNFTWHHMYQSAHIIISVLNNKDGFQALIDINPVSD